MSMALICARINFDTLSREDYSLFSPKNLGLEIRV